MKNKLFINGFWQDCESRETYSRVNPVDPDEILGPFQKGNCEDAAHAIDAAEDASDAWALVPPPERARYLIKVGELLEQQKENLAITITREMGKTISESKSDVQMAIDLAYYVAGEGSRLFGHTTTSQCATKFAFTIRVPVGIVSLITPWNFPILIPARKIFYSIVCGNTVVFKPSSNSPECAIALVEIFEKAGLPKGVVNLVTGPGEVIGDRLISDKRVRMISFCGHKDTGAKIMREAGVKRVSLELGGKNPLIVMDDADLELAADAVVCGGYATAGQRCTSTSRVIVHEKVKEKLEEKVVKRIGKLRLGNGLDPETDVGPLVNKEAQEKMMAYCLSGQNQGAKLLVGGQIPGNVKGWFFEPTLFTDCDSKMKICQEEIFGPIVSILSSKNLDEAIEVANSVDYGLSSSIYTNNIANVLNAIKRLQAGQTYINHPTIGSEVHLPFGGVKSSGSNKEGGPDGTVDYTELKTVYVDYSNQRQSLLSDDLRAPHYGAP
jgi:acyl-CoA reductase-like NAD-dependent aldehyde dehydrogenase